MLKSGIRSLERVNPDKHLKRDHRERKPIRVGAEGFGMTIPHTLHQDSRRKRRRLITIDVDKEEFAEIGRDEKVHLVQIDDQNPTAVNVRHARL